MPVCSAKLIDNMAIRYQVIVEQIPENHISMLKALREWGGFGLKPAKELCEYLRSNCPCVLVAGIKQEAVEDLRKRLDRAGVKIGVQKSAIKHPMLVCPQADDRYENHWFFGLRRRSREA
jgi:Ribosomal protein L7/L12 C-terminal domain